MRFWKKLEIEWKVILLAVCILLFVGVPLHNFYIARITTTLNQSIDPGLDSLLRSYLPNTAGESKEELKNSLLRHRQWRALIPIKIKEQSRAFLLFSIALLLIFILIAFWLLRRLTRPLKDLALAVKKIGRGQRAEVYTISGGALGTVERAVSALQEELGILREKARVQGMEKAWQEIARHMAHEIKNPLTPIRLSIDRIEEKINLEKSIDNGTLLNFLHRMNSQVDALERLVNQFRSFSKEPEVHITTIEIDTIISDIAADLSGSISTDIRGNALVHGDPFLLNQIFLNLWKNALEAGADQIHVTISCHDKMVTLLIRDNGCGISADKINQVWLPYVTLTKGGTGLGLAVVKKLIETMHGTISLSASTGEVDHGVTLYISLPAPYSPASTNNKTKSEE